MKYFTVLFFALFLFSCQEKNISPTCMITSPDHGTIFKKGEVVSVLVEANDEDGLITEVGILLNKNPLDIKSSSPYEFTVNTENLELGKHEISAYAIDDGGFSTSTFLNFHIEIFVAEIQVDSLINVSESSATIRGSVTDSGGGEIIKQGICWATSENPTTADSVKLITGSSLEMETEISGLLPNTLYYFRFFAENESGISYSENTAAKTGFLMETFQDSRDGLGYKSVKIGELTWMAENLKYLPNVKQPTQGSISSDVKYVYGQIACGCLGKAKANENYKIYGALYNYVSANEVCPEGWRLPSDDEWQSLANLISTNNQGYQNTEGSFENVGKHLKSAELWNESETGIDDYGFSALPGGFRDSESLSFLGLTNEAYFWTASAQSDSTAWAQTIKADDSSLYKQEFAKSNGFSVRCVKD